MIQRGGGGLPLLLAQPLTVTFPALVGKTEASDCIFSVRLSWQRDEDMEMISWTDLNWPYWNC